MCMKNKLHDPLFFLVRYTLNICLNAKFTITNKTYTRPFCQEIIIEKVSAIEDTMFIVL